MAKDIEKAIKIIGACEHNLKNISLSIPRDQMVVITGVSGSGKSSLAFDTIYAEGRRKYVESLSAYARQFLEQMQKPAVSDITGLPPTIAIEQRTVDLVTRERATFRCVTATDPTIVPGIVPIVEAMIALVLIDHAMLAEAQDHRKEP